MPSKPAAFERYVDPIPRLIFTLTAGILFVQGLTMVYRDHLTEVLLSRTFSLSSLEWVAFTAGPFLLEPVLLFGALYYVYSQHKLSLSLTALLPGLVVAVVVGNLLGQFVGMRLWTASGRTIPLARASFLLVPGWYSVQAWVTIIEPLAQGFTTALAALGLAAVRKSKA